MTRSDGVPPRKEKKVEEKTAGQEATSSGLGISRWPLFAVDDAGVAPIEPSGDEVT